MYGIVQIGGHQYHVKPGMILDVEKLNATEGALIDLENILFIGGESSLVGLPQVKGAKIQAKVVKQGRGKKVIILKRKPGQWVKKNGHRQPYTSILITEIHNGQGQSAKIDAGSKLAQKFLK